MPEVNAHRADRDAINVVYKRLRRGEKEADISQIIRELQEIVDEAITVQPARLGDRSEPYDISQIDFDKLKEAFAQKADKHTTTQNLKCAVERKVQRLLQQNPLRADFQQRYEEIVAAYNDDKNQATIEATFEALMKLVRELDEEEKRAIQEGLDEEQLAIFDRLIKGKGDLTDAEHDHVRKIAIDLLKQIKEQLAAIDQWHSREATRDQVKTHILNFLYADPTGLPEPTYTLDDVRNRTNAVYEHVFWAYKVLPSPYYQPSAA